MPCSAYVSFTTQEEAQVALKELNGKEILKGTKSLRVEFYQRANRFIGAIDKNELINNTHFRVLFVKGMFKDVTRE